MILPQMRRPRRSKDHWNVSATSAYLTQRHIDGMIARGELTHRVEVYGGVGMCFGMRPDTSASVCSIPTSND